MNTLLVIDRDAPIYVAELKKRKLTDLIIHSAEDQSSAENHIEDANIILGRPADAAPLLARAKKLHWLQSTFAGIEPLCSRMLRTDYLLTGVKDVFGPLMSEYIFAYILAKERSLFETMAYQHNKEWSPSPYQSLTNLTIGIIGLGSIGKRIAATAHHFGMQVLGMKRTIDTVDNVDQIFLSSQKSAFLPLVDYLVITLPATKQTNNFIGIAELKLMKPTSIVMSVGRGSNIDQDELISALHNKYIGGAVLDVFEQEPLPATSPLWDMPDVCITPHNSAFSFPAQITSLFCKNYARFVSGRTLKYVVDFENGY